MNPYLEQHKGQGQQHKAIRGILGGGPAADLPLAAIAGFDAKPTPIEGAGIAGSESQVELDKHQPVGVALVTASAASRGKYPTEDQRRGELLAMFSLER